MRLLIPRSYSTPATFILVKFCLAGQILSTRTLSGLRIGGRLTNRPCMDSAEGDAIVRFRAPGSILITRDYFRQPLSSLQGLLNRGVWKRQTCHVPFRDSIPVYRVGLRPLIRLPYSTPRVAISSDLHRIASNNAPWKHCPGSVKRRCQPSPVAVAMSSIECGRGFNPRWSQEFPQQNDSPSPDLTTWVQNRPPELIGPRKRIPGRGEDYRYFPGWPEDQHSQEVLVVASWPSGTDARRFASGRGFESRCLQIFASFPTPARNSTFCSKYPHSKVRRAGVGLLQGWWRGGHQWRRVVEIRHRLTHL